MPRTNDRALTVRLPASLYDELAFRSSTQDRTVASLLRVLARQYLQGVATEEAANDPGFPEHVR